MLRTTVAIVLALAGEFCIAQITPVGLWKTISDKDGSVASEVRIVEASDVLSAKIEKVFRADFKPDSKCVECKDDRKDQPVIGLEIMRGLKKAEGKDVWEGGTIVDPDNGTVYRARVTPVDGGKKLEMRGYLGAPLFGRTQTWIRIQ
ncbi:MAG: DUF2147 domain-containing protein [Burkholderiales bacterium]